MTTFTTMDREEEEGYLREQIHVQQAEIDRLRHKITQIENERDAYQNAYAALLNHNISKSRGLDDDDIDGRC
jgi:hypothetical protein